MSGDKGLGRKAGWYKLRLQTLSGNISLRNSFKRISKEPFEPLGNERILVCAQRIPKSVKIIQNPWHSCIFCVLGTAKGIKMLKTLCYSNISDFESQAFYAKLGFLDTKPFKIIGIL